RLRIRGRIRRTVAEFHRRNRNIRPSAGRPESPRARTRLTKSPLAPGVRTPNQLRALLFGLPLWSRPLSTRPTLRSLQAALSAPGDPEPETSISPAPSEASSDGSLLSSQPDRAWHFLEA